MENSNRPVQRVIPIRSEIQNRLDSNLNLQSSSSFAEATCGERPQHFKLINNCNDLNSGNSHNVIDSLPFVQQNVNIMNINLSNNTIIQGMSQDSSNSFSQTSGNPKTYLQLSDGRYVQIAQNIQPAQHQMPTTILVQMPYKLLDQPTTNTNQALMNKRFLLPSKVGDKLSQIPRFITMGNNANNCNNMMVTNQHTELYAKVDAQIKQMELQTQPLNDYQRNMIHQLKEVKDQINSGTGDSKLSQDINANGTIIAMDKYQEICDMLQEKKLLTKSVGNEEIVLVEFRLNQQKYQLRMTRNQKMDMEKLLISAGNQQRQMEILQVYQSEQRKNMQQRTSVVLNQIINKTPPNLVCNSPQIQTLNMTKPIFPLNPVIMTMPQSQYNDGSIIQHSNVINQSKNSLTQSTVSLQNPNGAILTARVPIAQSSIMSVPSFIREPVREIVKQKRATKAPINFTQNIPNLTSNQDMKPARSRRFNNMRRILLDDQNSVTMPDCSEAFENLNDVAKRLLPYHILEESKDRRFDEVDRILSTTFTELNKRCINLKRIASSITIHDMITEKSDEQLLIKRMQLDLERDALDREKSASINDTRHTVAPVDFPVDYHNSVIIIEDSPLPSPELSSVSCDRDRDPDQIGDCVDRSMSFIESMECSDRIREDTDNPDNIFDNVCNYDITDLSSDSIEDGVALVGDDNGDNDRVQWANDGDGDCGDHCSERCSPPIIEIDDDDDEQDIEIDIEEANQQSADPDLDAAIKSILF